MHAVNLELAVIGNCQISALLDERGAIVWCCLPRPDGDPVFSALLSPAEGVGRFAIEMANFARSEQRYLSNTAIVETILHDTQGAALRIVDFCPRFRSRGRMFRPMSLARIVEPAVGRPAVRIVLSPTRCYGQRAAPTLGGSSHQSFRSRDVGYRVTTDFSLTAIEEGRYVVLDRPVHFLLGPDETVEESLASLLGSMLAETRIYWQDWVRTLSIPCEWQEAVIRAAITLKLCTYEDTGALLAALTTSIPEAPDSGRNWDYRYCWLRDSYFVIQAMNRLGVTGTMEAFLHFIDNIVSSNSAGALQPLYSISGEPRLEEYPVPSLQGYRGMGPVRIGNDAAVQNQHDVYGSVILAATQLFFDARLVSRGDKTLFDRLQLLGEHASSMYELPDAGPWELRGTQQVHTFSAAMSWAGCDRLVRIANRIGDPASAARWRPTAQNMRSRILTRAWNESRAAFASTLGGSDLDASTLLLPELGLIAADDPRFVATVATIGRELRHGDLLFRYRHADDFGEPQTSFAICAFWYVNALHGCGQVEEARALFERLLSRRTRLGLLSEDIAPATGELWGNFPQTYSMVGIINSALRLSRSWEEML
ncbi:MAG: glycoside hydrolase family 15 protein [Pseudomonadota bacterium]